MNVNKLCYLKVDKRLKKFKQKITIFPQSKSQVRSEQKEIYFCTLSTPASLKFSTIECSPLAIESIVQWSTANNAE